MKQDRRFIAKAAALVLAVAAIVVPVTIATAAPEKIFGITMAPSSIPAGSTGVTLTATFKNATPSGNSSINSVRLAAAGAPGATITSATGIGNEVIAADGRSVSVSGIPPVKPGKTYVLTMKLTTPAQTSCSGTSITWSGSAWTGSSFSGDSFRFVAGNSSVGTSIGASCDLRFVEGRQPADAVQGGTITSVDGDPEGLPVQVALFSGASPAAWFTGPITLAISDDSTGTGALTGGIETAVAGTATFDELSIDAPGQYRLVASGADISSDPSSSFTISETALSCDEGSNTFEESGDAGALSLVRQEGACEQDIPVTVEIGDHQFDISKPFVSGSAFRMTIDWVVETPQNPVPATKVDYLDGFGPHDMQFCMADGPDDNIYPDLPPRNDAGPGDEFWCITNQTVNLFETGPNAGKLQLTESYFGAGDPRLTR
jgi:hypothetical protein